MMIGSRNESLPWILIALSRWRDMEWLKKWILIEMGEPLLMTSGMLGIELLLKHRRHGFIIVYAIKQ